jgi:hypothetical protein
MINDDQGPSPTYSEKRKENLSTEEKSHRNERRSLVGSCTTVQFPSLSPLSLSLSLADAVVRFSLLQVSGKIGCFGRVLISGLRICAEYLLLRL